MSWNVQVEEKDKTVCLDKLKNALSQSRTYHNEEGNKVIDKQLKDAEELMNLNTSHDVQWGWKVNLAGHHDSANGLGWYQCSVNKVYQH